MGYDTIHETVISDVVEELKAGYNLAKSALRGRNTSNYGSITKASKGLILEFPILVSKANHIESAGIVAKAYEAKFVTMLQLLFAASNITNCKEGLEYIKQFHTNLDFDRLSVDDFISIMDTVVEHNSANMSADSYSMCKAVMEDMKNLSYYFADDINESSLDSYKVMKNYGGLKVVKEAIEDPVDAKIKLDNDSRRTNNDSTRTANDTLRTGSQVNRNDMQNYYDGEDLKLKTRKDERDTISNTLNTIKTSQDIVTNYLIPSEIKKANELTPTMMIVNFVYAEEGMQPIRKQMVIGVKAKLYEVEPLDVISKIISKNVDSNLLLKLVKVSTREISFVKDFLLAIDDAKVDALSRSKRGSTNKLFKVLERRAINGKIRRSLNKQDYTKAISSLVISQEEVEELLKNNIDVSNPKVIRPIMEKLNLISFAIIDESSESVKFLFDTGDDVYETIPLSKLEREQRDGMSKKVINLMAKMNR